MKGEAQVDGVWEEGFMNNRDYTLREVKKEGGKLKYASQRFRNDKEIVLEAVKQNGFSLQYASESLKSDRDVVFEASIGSSGYALKYAGYSLRNNASFLLKILRETRFAGRNVMKFACEDLKKDRNFVLEAMKGKLNGAETLLFVSKEFRNDKEIVFEAVKSNFVPTLQYAGDTLRKDRSFLLDLIENQKFGGDVMEYADEVLRNDEEFALEVVKRAASALKYVNEELKNCKDFILQCLKVSNSISSISIFDHISEELRCDEDIIKQGLSRSDRQTFASEFIGKKALEAHTILKILKKNRGSIEATFDDIEEDFESVNGPWESFLLERLEEEVPTVNLPSMNKEHEIDDDERREREFASKRMNRVSFRDLKVFRH